MTSDSTPKPAKSEDERLQQTGNGWRTARDRIRNSLTGFNSSVKKGVRESATEQAEDEQPLPSPFVDPELHRLITEWRISRTRESYMPYSEAELRRFGQQWKVGSAKYAPSEEEVREKLKDLELIHTSLERVVDKFYELSWTRNTQDYWHHIWVTLHLAGATVEEVWEITHGKWPKLLKEKKSFGPMEVEDLRTSSKLAGGLFSDATLFCPTLMLSTSARVVRSYTGCCGHFR